MESITLADEPASVGLARRFVQTQIAGRGFDDHAAVLLTSELVTNAIRHAMGEVTVGVGVEKCLRVEVYDDAVATSMFRDIVFGLPASTLAPESGGRGLPIVRLIASRFGLDDSPDTGKVIWFELDPES